MTSDAGTIRLGKTISFSWEILVGNLGSLLILSALVNSPGFLLQVFSEPVQFNDGFEAEVSAAAGLAILAFILAAVLFMILFYILTSMAVSVIVQESVLDRPVSLGSALKTALPRLLPGLGTLILGALLLFGWSLLLVIPGMIYALYYMFQGQAVALRGESFMGAIRYSRNLVRGYWWRLAWILFVCTVIMMLAVGVPVTATVFFTADKVILSTVAFVLNVAATAYFSVVMVVLFLALECLKGQGVVSACQPRGGQGAAASGPAASDSAEPEQPAASGRDTTDPSAPTPRDSSGA